MTIFREVLVPSLSHRFVPDIWFDEPGDWADLPPAALHMWFQEPWEYVTEVAR